MGNLLSNLKTSTSKCLKSKPPTFELKKDDNTASQLSSLGQKISERFIEVSTKNKDHRFDKENEKI